jgi:hypothetical protein
LEVVIAPRVEDDDDDDDFDLGLDKEEE